MKKIALLGAVAALALPAFAVAQTPAPAPPAAGAPTLPSPGQFGAAMQQMRQLRAQERTQMLNALTPAHRTLLAQVVGTLATAPTPDFDAAVRQLDAALSTAEKQSIVAARDSFRTQMRNQMTQMRRGMPMPRGDMPMPRGDMPMPPSGAAPAMPRGPVPFSGASPRPADAGRILLTTVLPGPERGGAPQDGRRFRRPL